METSEQELDHRTATPQSEQLQGGTYEIIRNRLKAHGGDLRERLNQLNLARRDVYGGVDARLLATERILTKNNCEPRDMVALGSQLLFGYNVQLGLRSETSLSDVFAVYEFNKNSFEEQPLGLIEDEHFKADFEDLYKYYKHTRFVKFARMGAHLFMIFRMGKELNDIKVFKWWINDDKTLKYVDNRSDHEYRFPAQHEFEWTRVTRDMQRSGSFPHLSIEDRLFVETTGGDLTLKVEDNTDSGLGIYQEDVDDADQTLDDAEIYYSCVGNLILLKVKPYREQAYRYIIFNEKVQEATRVDAIAGACVLLPEDHGLIFSNGYYLQTGEYKQFDSALAGMLFERRIASPNGEDFLYVFYNRRAGSYVLLSYNIINQTVETPIECNGLSLFPAGELIYFKAQEDPSKSHVVQIWQTPYSEEALELPEHKDSLLYKIGNRDIVRCMAGCQTLQGLIHRDDSYANLYLDISRQANDLLDSYFWINDKETYALGIALAEIKSAADTAIGEFEKVSHQRNVAKQQLAETEKDTESLLNDIHLMRHDSIEDHVKTLAAVRALRGRVISLRELRHVDRPRVDELENRVREQGDVMAQHCIVFLLEDDAMAPYVARMAALDGRIDEVAKVRSGEELAEEIEGIAGELEMLIDTVSNLEIDDATQRTAIIESITSLFSSLNQSRASLRAKVKALASVEGKAEFASQIKLLDQAVMNYLDICDSPDKCEMYLSKTMVQLEELEGKFADFEAYLIEISDKREEIHNAFETRRLSLMEQRNKKSDRLAISGERILKSIRSRAEGLDSVEALNGYFASDLMIEKVRALIEQLQKLDDPVKADDLQTRLKSLREDAVRQLHDRSELFVGGENIIQLGRHRFSVNVRDLDLTIVPRGEDMFLHLTGTDFFEKITDAAFCATRSSWSQEQVSENDEVYRAEFLAYSLLKSMDEATRANLVEAKKKQVIEVVQEFMATRYAEGYQKGVHDEDAGKILQTLIDMHENLGFLRVHGDARALAIAFWHAFVSEEDFKVIEAQLLGLGEANRIFKQSRRQAALVVDLEQRLGAFASAWPGEMSRHAALAAEYLVDIIARDGKHPISPEAARVYNEFRAYLEKLARAKAFQSARSELKENASAEYGLIREWVMAYISSQGDEGMRPALEEVTALIFADQFASDQVGMVSARRKLSGLRGTHKGIEDGSLELNYTAFMDRLGLFNAEVVPRFKAYRQLKKEWVGRERKAMRLEEFEPQVLTSFVRNRLIDKVYLPLVGDNLAKQIGVVGEATRTDRMGLLMLISPPGYGKTTLMEYVANRMGLVFMKINGPAIGHHVTSLDPSEAPNAAAREELKKLGLALEMGDNVMLYVDDIQHCNPEFLQKFISLCDAQRKIEGVYKGQTRTYDLRGKKIAVVMAGNPYTESGEAFRIPDMLANRADTYNLGDILGDNAEAFELSFLENALTSNPALNRLASADRSDIHTMIHMAGDEVNEGLELKGVFDASEVEDMLSVMKKLIRVRDVVLNVNAAYILSAGQSDEFRTEPAFRLQGSYRNMNRLAEKVSPIMNEAELETLIFSEYQNEAQTLTTGAEANLLKFREITGTLSDEDQQRWDDIVRTYARNQLTRGAEDDRVGQAVIQLATLGEGLHDIRDILKEGVGTKETGPTVTGFTEETLTRLENALKVLRTESKPMQQPLVVPRGVSDNVARLLEQQYDRMQEVLTERDPKIPVLRRRLKAAGKAYLGLLDEIGYGGGSDGS